MLEHAADCLPCTQSKVLVLDEGTGSSIRTDKVIILMHTVSQATSAVDLDTDAAIQEIIRGHLFRDVTMLTIAYVLTRDVVDD